MSLECDFNKKELEELFNEVGFIIEEVQGDLDKNEYLQSNPALILIAKNKMNILLFEIVLLQIFMEY